MLFWLVSAMALLAVTSANPIEQRTIAQEFDVSEFSAGCIPHGTGCSFSFNVATNQMPEQTNCNASFTVAYNLPDVAFTACADPSIYWSFNAIDSGNYTLILVANQQGLAAAKVWDAIEFPVIDAGATVYQQYTGPSSFIVE